MSCYKKDQWCGKRLEYDAINHDTILKLHAQPKGQNASNRGRNMSSPGQHAIIEPSYNIK